MSSTDIDARAHTFVTTAAKCEALASREPSAYRRAVIAYAALGYLFPPLFTLLLAGLGALCVWLLATHGVVGALLAKKIGGAVLLVALMVGRSMWPKFGEPDGIPIKADQAPRLFELIQKLRAEIGTPPIHAVRITNELNAAVVQTPRLGVFGWYRNELLLGLPLLQALSREETAGVIAHELAHLSATHGKLGAWIYRTRLQAARIQEAIEQKAYFGSYFFRRFYRWYEPFFAAYSFAMARAHEYEADRLAASVTDHQVMADSLVRLRITAHYETGAFWPEVWRAADDASEPSSGVYERLGQGLVSLSTQTVAPEVIESIQSETSSYGDTHPAARDRASALGVALRCPPALGSTGATLLRDNGAALMHRFSEQWSAAAAEAWREHHGEMQEAKATLAELDTAAANGTLTEDDAMARGRLTERFKGPEEALACYEDAIAAFGPVSNYPLYAKGRVLLELGQPEGLSCIDEVMGRDDEAILSGCELAEAFLARADRHDEAARYRERRLAHEQLTEADTQDRCSMNVDDQLIPHDVSTPTVEHIVQCVAPFLKKGLRKVWLVRKATRHRQAIPAHFLVCEVDTLTRFTGDIKALQHALVDALAPGESTGDIKVMIWEAGEAWLRDMAQAVPDALILER